MNKLAIPAILAIIVIIAGIFAFSPVEKAATVHTTIQNTQQAVVALSANMLGGAATNIDAVAT